MGFAHGLFFEDTMQIIKALSEATNSTRQETEGYLKDAPEKYKVYYIAKRTHGYRRIAQPTKKLKEYQRALIQLLDLPVHPCATAYRKNHSIKQNAEKHKNNQYLLKMDIENFFNSITPELFIHQLILNDINIDGESLDWIIKTTFWNPSKKNDKLILSVGAPSSPEISNFCMYDFDKKILDLCKSEKITYTRYADDMTFTTNIKGILFGLPEKIKGILKETFKSKLNINNRKTKFSSKRHNRHITGITITNDNRISIGRKRKRYIKHLIFQFTKNKISSDEISRLNGYLSFAENIEKSFIKNLEKKYGKETITKIRSQHERKDD